VQLVADIQGKDGGGAIYTLAKGMLIVNPDVTRLTT
jgi:hypothetical protein